MTVHRGIVESWSDDEGWGLLRAPDVDGPVFAHFSHIESDPNAFRSLRPGAAVSFAVERADQDGCDWRAVWVREG